jgi:hypothetical protein
MPLISLLSSRLAASNGLRFLARPLALAPRPGRRARARLACSGLLLCALAAGCETETQHTKQDAGARTPEGDGATPAADGATPSGDGAVPGADGGVPDAQLPDPGDAGMDAAPPPAAHWDAAAMGPPQGMAYAEEKGTFVLEEPAALKAAFGTFTSDTGEARLFLNDVRASDAGTEVYYGGAFVEDTGAYFQYPNKVKRFEIAPSVDDEQTFVSKPFDYELFAWVPSANDPDVGYELSLGSTQAVWVAKFDAAFEHISDGSLTAIVLRSEAEVAPFELDPLSCLAVCKDLTACTGGLATLADLLDCNKATLNVDADGDGEKDGYRLRFSFRSERVTLAP